MSAPVTEATERRRQYLPVLTAVENTKGVLDVDTVKGCTMGMRANPGTGCYGACYAAQIADRYGIDFASSVTRLADRATMDAVFSAVRAHPTHWYRIGTAGDPCHDWNHTVAVCEVLERTGKIPVIITKHWIPLSDQHLSTLQRLGAVVNTSTSGLDSDAETTHRLRQIERVRSAGVRSINRIVTCEYSLTTEWSRRCNEKQQRLLQITPMLDNPLRPGLSHPRVLSGELLVTTRADAVGGGKHVSLHDNQVYLGKCPACPDQCGVGRSSMAKTVPTHLQISMFKDQTGAFDHQVEWLHLTRVLGTEYAADIARLAIEDGIAERAARKNMQIHSAIVLLIDGEFSGFFTFQSNELAKEFCLLQSVIRPDRYTPELYKQMVLEVLACNEHRFPALITTDPKSKFETPALFESVGFQTYLKMSGFHYMVKGKLADARMKILAHITMTNVWITTKGDWLSLKREWRKRIEDAGETNNIPNPSFATREGCWQGENGYANVVNTRRKVESDGSITATTKSHNGNASVLDPVACEVIARFFMPTAGRRIYNPFGGGVQFGFVSGACGYEYVASEIRQNQCDANNALCSEFPSVKWIRSNSAIYEPEGMFDLVFSCPPYYRVEKYVDYDGASPDGEINCLPTYDRFRDTLFAGYRRAIQHLNDGCFFVVMTGDSRDKTGAYYCSEAEHELFFKTEGLSVYNRIVYVECEFTRLAHAKKTLNMRKFPKREQKIIVAYKGNIKEIGERFAPIGRL